MNSKIKKQIKKYQKLQDVFATTRHAERSAIRLKWKDVDLDADPLPTPMTYLQLQKETKYWQDLQSPCKISKDSAKSSGYRNDTSMPNKNNLCDF